MNWYFACWYKFTSQSYFNNFWVGMVRNGRGHLVHETLKSAVSKEWVYEMDWFFACWLWGQNFWLDWHCTLYLWLLNANLLQLYLLEPWQWLDVSYEIGSARPSILLSVKVFSRIRSLGFSEFRHCTRNPCQAVRDRTRFFGITFFGPQSRGNGPKIGQNRGFWI